MDMVPELRQTGRGTDWVSLITLIKYQQQRTPKQKDEYVGLNIN